MATPVDSLIILYLLLVQFLFINAIYFPGSCPIISNTSGPDFNFIMKNITAFPFSGERKSYIFNEISLSNSKAIEIFLTTANSKRVGNIMQFGIHIKDIEQEVDQQTFVDIFVLKCESQCTLNTTVDFYFRNMLKPKLACFTQITEVVQFLYFNDLFVFWSCTDDAPPDGHYDAAALIAKTDQNFPDHNLPAEIVAIITNPPGLDTHYKVPKFSCPEREGNIYIYAIAPTILLFSVFLYLKKFKWKNNQIVSQ